MAINLAAMFGSKQAGVAGLPLDSLAHDTWSPSGDSIPATNTGQRVPLRCGRKGCDSSTRPWKKQARPIFEGQWMCGRDCLRAAVEDAVRREVHDAALREDATAHRHRIPLGLVLLVRGWITQAQLQHALQAQRRAGEGRIGDWLVNAGATREHVMRGLGVQWNRPVLGTAGFEPQVMARVMPPTLMQRSGLIPLRVAGGRVLYVAAEDGTHAAASYALERMTGLAVESGLLASEEFQAAGSRLGGCPAVECRAIAVGRDGSAAAEIAATVSASKPVEARLVQMEGSFWLRMWLEPAAIGLYGTLPATGEDVIDLLFQVSDRAA